MSKVVISLAERLAQLRIIPPEKIPTTLKHDIVLPKFQEIRFESARNAKEFGPMYNFYRKYIADMRYHNPALRIVRDVTETGPLIARILLIKK
jgi:hypothetical protein